MGEHQNQPEPDVVRLQRESQQLLADLKAKLHELDEARARGKHRPPTPEQRRRSFRLIQGGAVAAALVWVWEVVRRPAVAVGSGTGVVATSAFMAAPMVAPGTAAGQPPEPLVVSIVSVEPTEAPTVVVVEKGDEAEEPARRPDPAPSTTSPQPRPKPTATPTATAEPEPEPVPKPDPLPDVTDVVTPLPTPTATATAEVDVCLEVGLPATAPLKTCLAAAERLGLELGL